jgi:hypothetical protein
MGVTAGAAACKTCDPSCRTCDDEGPTGCLTCPTGAKLKVCGGGTTGSCHCDVGSFFNGTTCATCNDINCDICSEDGNTCYRCKPDKFMNNGRCKFCETGFTLNAGTNVCDFDPAKPCTGAGQAKDGICLPCHDSCGQCDGSKAQDCKSCIDPKMTLIPLTDGGDIGSCTCKDGTFLSKITWTCEACDVNCASCTDNSLKCTACWAHENMTLNNDLCVCADKFVWNECT